MAGRQKVVIAYEVEPQDVPETAAPESAKAVLQEPVPLDKVAVLTSTADNCAIATRGLAPGLQIDLGQEEGIVTLQHSILEGHRFAIQSIAPGERLTSWDLGFGIATVHINAGDYCCNDSILEALRARAVDAILPETGNFENHFDPLPDPERTRDHSTGVVPLTVDAEGRPLGFQGFPRAGGRGVGTRNYAVIIGTTAHAAAFVRQVERHFRTEPKSDNFDGVVAVAHTEGADLSRAQNRALIVRSMAGFLVHPNVGACLVVDHSSSPLRSSIEELIAQEPGRYPGTSSLPTRWLQLSTDVAADLEAASTLLREMLGPARQAQRCWQPAKHLTLALQCGGSDAFSGVCGNPSSGATAKQLIAAGGCAVLAETDELMGAEAYILERTKNRAVEEQFLGMVQRYHDYARRHGHSAEGNPSGGNKFRGLYNIALKSLGAAMKKPRDVRLDGVLEYGQRMTDEEASAGGYFFMDSPGNDPESIAGQVASGCNMIHFITGNGSITNFPFVPTVKVITTTARWNLLSQDMDFNAGRLQEGLSLEQLSDELFHMTLRIAGGERSAGERAGHWQVSLWRDWYLGGATDNSLNEATSQLETSSNEPLATRTSQSTPSTSSSRTWDAVQEQSSGATAAAAKALILPTSLCSGQVALKIAEQLRPQVKASGLDGIVAIPHSEGCGTSSSKEQDTLFRAVTLGHLLHPAVQRAVLLEHGCEKTHNDWFHARLLEAGVDPKHFIWASIQLDGGIDKVASKISAELLKSDSTLEAAKRAKAGVGQLRVGFMADHRPGKVAGKAAAAMLAELVSAGGLAVVPRSSYLLKSAEFLDEILEGGEAALRTSAAFASPLARNNVRGLHVMACPPKLSPVEEVTGLAATGVDVILALVTRPVVGSPLVPVVQALCTIEAPLLRKAPGGLLAGGFDVLVDADTNDTSGVVEELWSVALEVVSGKKHPALFGGLGEGSVDFVIPRGPNGISL